MKATRLLNAVLLLASALNDLGSNAATKDDFPRVWISSEDHADAAHFADLATHGAQVIETEDFKRAREHGLQIIFMVGRIGPQDVIRLGMTPEYAVAIGGTYNDLSIESHTFPITKGQHTIEIFQPWFYAPFDWKRQQYLTNNRTFGDYFGEFSTDRAFKAEVLVKQRDYDGKQHLAIVPATVTERKRHSLFVTFDLSNIDGDVDPRVLRSYQQVILCVRDLDGLPLDQFAKEKIPLSIVCWNGDSLAAHSGFTGVKFSSPLAAGAVVASRAGKAPLSAALAVGVTLESSASALANSGEQPCLWRHRSAVFASFIPRDPFDDGEYVRWLLDEKQAPDPKRSNN